jgi:hypothetical protein
MLGPPRFGEIPTFPVPGRRLHRTAACARSPQLVAVGMLVQPEASRALKNGRHSTSLWAHELAPGRAIRAPPTMLANDAE